MGVGDLWEVGNLYMWVGTFMGVSDSMVGLSCSLIASVRLYIVFVVYV